LKIRFPLLGVCLLALCLSPAWAQEYRNILNSRFHTVSSGPMQGLLVDVPDASDTRAVRAAVAARVNRVRQARESVVRRQIEFLRQTGRLRGAASPGIPDLVIVREKGRLVIPAGKTRAHDGNELTFVFPAAGETGAWPVAEQNALQTIINIVYDELKQVYGPPAWSGTVKIIDGDAITPIISDRNALSGGVFNLSTNEIIFAEYNAVQTKVLSLTQMMALAFRGPASISYDAWERGMARAATLVTVRNVLPALEQAFGQGSVDVSDPLWHGLDRYDLLNQPPLGNDRFFPVSKVNDPVDQSSLAGMLVPRLMMAGSAWLKGVSEDPAFLRNFNNAYYHALSSNPNLKNSIPELKQLARAALSQGQVEGLDFLAWYERQFVLDTSVSPGAKLYAWVLPLRPDPAEDDFAVGVVLVYYRTAFDTSGNSDERNLNGTCYPIYWDYTFGNRLFLAAQYERVDIRDGLGTVAPTFFNTIGGTDQHGRMRITIDFPVNLENVRIHIAPRSMGKINAPNNFWGVVVGADSGRMKIETETGVTAEFDVIQGSFGGVVDPNAFSRPGRSTLTFTNSQSQQTVRRINTGYNEYAAVFHVNDPVVERTRALPPGPAMISFPIQPLRPKAAEALLDPNTDQPLFNENNLLLAQWRQDLPGPDKYLLYPSLDPLQPGKGYWENFAVQTVVKIVGKSTAQEPEVSMGLLHGWNQIATPYEQALNINDLQFQYLADNIPVGLQEAISRGWIVAENVPEVGQVVVWDFTTGSGYVRATTLEPWKGYWIRVLVSEGVTITYPNPATKAARSKGVGRRVPGVGSDSRRPTSAGGGWAIPLILRGPNGVGATAYLGQSDSATTGYDATLDALRPPDFSRAVPSIGFHHPDWGANAGVYYSDVRRSGSRDPWEVTVHTPEPNKRYTLSWRNLTGVPRSIRLLLEDTATGRRLYLQTASSYTFTASGSSTRKFRIIAEDRGRMSLRIFNVVARPSRAVGSRTVEIAYDLTAGAEVTTYVRAANGRLVRRLSSGRAATAGTNRALWDMRDERGIAVPVGTYLIQIDARTPEGDAARVVQPVTIVR